MLAEAYLEPGRSAVFAQTTFSQYAFVTRLMDAEEVSVPLKEGVHDLWEMATGPASTGPALSSSAIPTTPPAPTSPGQRSSASWTLSPGRRWWCSTRRTWSMSRLPIPGRAGAHPGRQEGGLDPHLLQDPRPRGPAGRLRRGARRRHRDAGAGAPSVQRQPGGPGRGRRRAARHRTHRDEPPDQPGRTPALAQEFKALGLRPYPSQANFVWVDLGRPSDEVYRGLLERGVIVRAGSSSAAHRVRISIGTPEQNQRLIDALAAVLEAAATKGEVGA